MTWRFAALSLLITLGVLTRFVSERAFEANLNSSPYPVNVSPSDPESLLATGATLPLACADMWSLQLITGVSDRMAEELLLKRERIIAAAETRPLADALQLARGIGKKTGVTLAKLLSTERVCRDEPPYMPFIAQDTP